MGLSPTSQWQSHQQRCGREMTQHSEGSSDCSFYSATGIDCGHVISNNNRNKFSSDCSVSTISNASRRRRWRGRKNSSQHEHENKKLGSKSKSGIICMEQEVIRFDAGIPKPLHKEIGVKRQKSFFKTLKKNKSEGAISRRDEAKQNFVSGKFNRRDVFRKIKSQLSRRTSSKTLLCDDLEALSLTTNTTRTANSINITERNKAHLVSSNHSCHLSTNDTDTKINGPEDSQEISVKDLRSCARNRGLNKEASHEKIISYSSGISSRKSIMQKMPSWRSNRNLPKGNSLAELILLAASEDDDSVDQSSVVSTGEALKCKGTRKQHKFTNTLNVSVSEQTMFIASILPLAIRIAGLKNICEGLLCLFFLYQSCFIIRKWKKPIEDDEGLNKGCRDLKKALKFLRHQLQMAGNGNKSRLAVIGYYGFLEADGPTGAQCYFRSRMQCANDSFCDEMIRRGCKVRDEMMNGTQRMSFSFKKSNSNLKSGAQAKRREHRISSQSMKHLPQESSRTLGLQRSFRSQSSPNVYCPRSA